MVFDLRCAGCGRDHGTVEMALDLRIPCTTCHCTTIYNTLGSGRTARMKAELAPGHSARKRAYEERMEATGRDLRHNHYVDASKC